MCEQGFELQPSSFRKYMEIIQTTRGSIEKTCCRRKRSRAGWRQGRRISEKIQRQGFIENFKNLIRVRNQKLALFSDFQEYGYINLIVEFKIKSEFLVLFQNTGRKLFKNTDFFDILPVFLSKTRNSDMIFKFYVRNYLILESF